MNSEYKDQNELFGLLFVSLKNNPFSWFIFVAFLIILNTVGWYYRFSLLGDAFNKNTTHSTIFSFVGDLSGIILFRLFEYVCIFGFFLYLFRYGK